MNQNIFCSQCHRIPSQCCCSSAKELTDEEIEKLASSIFTEDQTYQYSDVYKFAKALLQKAREK